MGKWSIKELDKSKTEQSIANEQTRLDICREKLDKLIKERDRYTKEVSNKLDLMNENIAKIMHSIESGEQFVRQCNEHLILDFKDAEGN